MNYRQYSNSSNYFWLFLSVFILLGGFRVVFAIFGLFLSVAGGFLPLILIGTLMYLLMGRIGKNKSLHHIANSRSKAHQQFLELLIHILVHMAKADNRVDEEELSVIRRYFRQSLRIPEQEMPWVNDLIESAIKQSLPIESCCAPFKTAFPDTFRLLVTELLYEVSHADKHITASEKTFIDKVILLMGVSKEEHDSIRAHYTPKASDWERYTAILGCSSDASPEEIKKAYREASKRYHPDKVTHLGEEFQRVSQLRMQEINEAYAALKKMGMG